MGWRGAEVRKTLWPEWGTDLYESRTANLISLTAVAAGFQRVWGCGSGQ